MSGVKVLMNGMDLTTSFCRTASG